MRESTAAKSVAVLETTWLLRSNYFSFVALDLQNVAATLLLCISMHLTILSLWRIAASLLFMQNFLWGHRTLEM